MARLGGSLSGACVVLGILTLMLTSCGTTHKVAPIDGNKTYGGAITYHLPITGVRVTVEEKKTVKKPSIFLTDRMTGKKLTADQRVAICAYITAIFEALEPHKEAKIITTESSSFSITKGEISTFGLQGERYVVRLDHKPLSEQTITIRFDEKGVITEGKSTGENLTIDYLATATSLALDIGTTLVSSGILADTALTGAEDMATGILPKESKGVPTDVKDRIDNTVKKLINAIVLRKVRYDSIAAAYAAKTKISIEPLDEEIEELLKALGGYTTVSKKPIKTVHEIDPTIGCHPIPTAGGKELTLQISTQADARPKFRQRPNTTRKGFHYRIPIQVVADLTDAGNRQLDSKRLLIGQLGETVYLPISFGGKKASYKITLDPVTGALLSYTNEGSTAFRPEDTIGALAPSAKEFAKALADQEISQLEREASEIELENRILKAEQENAELTTGEE